MALLVLGVLWLFLFWKVGNDAPHPYDFIVQFGLEPLGLFLVVSSGFVLFPRAPLTKHFLKHFREARRLAIAWSLVLAAIAAYLLLR
ncbi:MAG: hypothetical protein NEA02_10255 [Thermoanaerobaculia bacterium]|nr:hypothetical protein [Thermoanaerobaculia bacterium]